MSDETREDEAGFWPSARSRPYANHLEIAFSLSGVELCFAQAFADGRAAAHSWVLTTPVHLASFGQTITRTIASYEDRFGHIPGEDDGATPQSRQ